MVTNRIEHSGKRPSNKAAETVPNKISASTSYDFSGKNLTPYGGLLPVITMLEKLEFQSLVQQTVTLKRIPRALDLYRFVLGIFTICTLRASLTSTLFRKSGSRESRQ